MDNQSDKSEAATPYKLSEAKKKGQVGKSMEFVSIISMTVMLFGLIVSLPKLGHSLSFHLAQWFKNTNQMAESPALTAKYFQLFLADVIGTVGLIMLLGLVGAVLASLVHVGPVFSLHPLKFDLSKMNPVTGLKKIFSKKGLIDILKLILKVFFFSIALLLVWHQVSELILYPTSFSLVSLAANWKAAFTVLVSSLLVVFSLFAVFDLWHSKKEFATKMRMSTRDVKDEHKRREGNPEIKHKRKKNMMSLIRNFSGVSNLKDADVIITNPTHVAVALKYRSKSMAFPIVTAKGKGFFALWIIKKAHTYGVPVRQFPPLARKIYAESEVNHIIPLSEQESVAEIYKEILKTSGHRVFS